MRHAMIMTVHTNFNILQKFVELFDDTRYDFYILVDKKTNTPNEEIIKQMPKHSKLVFLPRMNIYWAGYSQIDAYLRLIETSSEKNYDYYHFLQGSDFPLKTKEYVNDFFEKDKIRYFDLRDEKEGYGVGHIQNFESVSYFNVLVGTGEQLFYSTDNGFAPRYTQSETILNSIFPKDAKIFAMCAVGGRVQPFCTLLKQYGYNMDNVYNVGGWKQVNAADNFGGYQVSRGFAAKEITYDFSSLTPVDA